MHRLPRLALQGQKSLVLTSTKSSSQQPHLCPNLAPVTSTVTFVPVQNYSQGKRPGFFSNILSNLKEESEKNTVIQDSLKKFREEAKKLEESEALKDARRKFENIEGKAKEENVFQEHVSGIKEKVKGTLDEVSKAEAVKRAAQMSEDLTKKAAESAKVVGSMAENIGANQAFQKASEGAESIKEEIEVNTHGHMYRPPTVLRKRKETLDDGIQYEANEDATGVELHKDSRFQQNWENFRDNNPFMKQFSAARAQVEESDNPVVRGTRVVADKLNDVFGGLFKGSKFSEALTEITKMDPDFCKEAFLKQCQTDIIPNILEAMIRPDLEILQDWCYEAPYNVLATPIRQAMEMGYIFESRVLDIDSLDLTAGQVLEQGPVLVITFRSQQIMALRNKSGEVVEGNPDKVLDVNYVWVLCRDQAELDPKACWRLLEMAANSNEKFF